MAYDAFLILAGVTGESQDEAMAAKGAIEIIDYKFQAEVEFRGRDSSKAKRGAKTVKPTSEPSRSSERKIRRTETGFAQVLARVTGLADKAEALAKKVDPEDARTRKALAKLGGDIRRTHGALAQLSDRVRDVTVSLVEDMEEIAEEVDEIVEEETVDSDPEEGEEPEGVPEHPRITVEKRLDSASPALFQAYCSVASVVMLPLPVPFATGQLVLRRSSNKSPSEMTPYLTIDLTAVHVVGYELEAAEEGDSETGDTFSETVTLAFHTIKITYTPQKPDGTPGAPIMQGFNLLENMPEV